MARNMVQYIHLRSWNWHWSTNPILFSTIPTLSNFQVTGRHNTCEDGEPWHFAMISNLPQIASEVASFPVPPSACSHLGDIPGVGISGSISPATTSCHATMEPRRGWRTPHRAREMSHVLCWAGSHIIFPSKKRNWFEKNQRLKKQQNVNSMEPVTYNVPYSKNTKLSTSWHLSAFGCFISL